MARIQDELQLTSTDATEVNLPIAGTGSRTYAFLIDWHIRLILAAAWLTIVAALLGLTEGQGLWDEIFDNIGSFIFYVVVLPPALIYFLYHPVLEIALKGRTPGKRAAGVRIVTLEGQTPDVAALLIRNIFRLVDSLPIFYVVGLITVLLSARQVRIGDMAAGTLLAYEKKLAGNAFERFAGAGDEAFDLPAMEVARDLLERWKTLEREKRSQIAAKLVASQGETLPVDISKHAFDVEMHRRLTKLVSNGFKPIATSDDEALDLPATEVARDLLERWTTLEPEKRSRIAAKLVANLGEPLPVNVSEQAFDREMHRRLMSLAHASRN